MAHAGYAPLPTQEPSPRLPGRHTEWDTYIRTLHACAPNANVGVGWDSVRAVGLYWLLAQLPEVPCVSLAPCDAAGRLQLSRLAARPPRRDVTELFWPDATVQAYMVARACVRAAALMRQEGRTADQEAWMMHAATHLVQCMGVRVAGEPAVQLQLEHLQEDAALQFEPCVGGKQDVAFPGGVWCCWGDPQPASARLRAPLRHLHDQLMDATRQGTVPRELVHAWCREARLQCGLPTVPVWWFGGTEWSPIRLRMHVITADPRNANNICIQSRVVRLRDRFEGRTAQSVVEMALRTPRTLEWAAAAGFGTMTSWMRVHETCAFRAPQDPPHLQDMRQVVLESASALMLLDIQWRAAPRPWSLVRALCKAVGLS
jgi:hypothetical protein